MATELKRATTTLDRIEELLGESARMLLDHKSQTIDKGQINLPGPDFIDRVWAYSDRSPSVLRSLQSLFDNGRLAGTGYLFNPAGRPGYRTFGRGVVCSESPVLRSGKYCEAGY